MSGGRKGVVLFPGVAEVFDVSETELTDPDDIIYRQSDLLARWKILGSEFKRRVDGIPPALSFELSELLRETDA